MRVLLVEDDVGLSDAIASAAREWTMQVVVEGGTTQPETLDLTTARTLKEGLVQLEASAFGLVLTDVALGSESALSLVERARRLEPAPVVVAISGEATAAQAFALAGLGARGYLAKPFDLHELRAIIQTVLSRPPDVESCAMAQVGHRHIHAVQDQVKLSMLKRALQLEGWNITRAARRLGVTRAAIQQMIDRFDLPRRKDASKA